MRFALLPCLALVPALSAYAEEPLRVEILTVTAEPRPFDFQLAGTIEAPDTIASGFRDGGRIVSVAVDAGDHLAKGAEIARVDATQARAAQDAAAATLAGAEAALTEARANHDRVTARLESGVATRAELDGATQALAAALGLRDQAAAQVVKADRAVEDTVLRAPQDAIVIARLAESGQVVGPGQTVVTLASDSRRVGVFYAPDSVDVDQFLGQHVVLGLIDQPLITLHATLTEVSPVIDTATGTIRVKAEIAEPPGPDPMLGAAVLGHLDMPSPAAIHLPWDALTATARGPAVWTVDPVSHAVALQPVTITGYDGGEITVGSGLEPGQQVVGAGSQLLYPGRQVSDAGGAP